MAARTDLDKYPYALHLSENFILLTEGAARRRAGFRYVNTVKTSNRAWLKRFDYGNQTYYLEFGHLYIRFYTNHGALLEAAKTITGATAANPVVITSNAHGFSNGQYVFITGMKKMRQLNEHFFRVANVAANTFELQDQDGVNINGLTYVADTTGTVARVYEIASPYTISGNKSLVNADGGSIFKTKQVGDVLYIAASSGDATTSVGYKPKKLTRISDTNWTLTDYAPVNGPFLEVNTTTCMMWTYWYEGTVGIYATKDLFSANSVGRLIKLTALQASVSVWRTGVVTAAGDYIRSGLHTYKALSAATTGTSTPTHTNGIVSDGAVLWEYQHSGYAIVKISAYTNPQRVDAIVQSPQPSDPSARPKVPIDLAAAAFNFTITNITSASPPVITAAGHTFVNGDVVAIDNVVGMTEVNGRYFVVTAVAANVFSLLGVDATTYTAYSSAGQVVKGATFNWQLGAWSDETNYPTSVAVCYGRIMWSYLNRFHGTVSNDFENMAEDDYGTVTADSAINALAPEVINTRWMVAVDRLFIGASNGEFLLREQTPNEPFGPNNSTLVKQGNKGCRDVDIADTGEYALFVQKAGKKVLASAYNFDADKVKSADVTAFARHLQKPYLIDAQFQAEPNSIYWAARSDGLLIAMTFDPDQNVNGWHRHPIASGGVVESIQNGLTPDGTSEELWAIIKKTINGVDRRYVCYMERPFDSTVDDIEDAFYVDSGVSFSAYQGSTLGIYASATVSTTGNFSTAAGTYKFIPADVGSRIVAYQGASRGVAQITAYINDTTVTVLIIESFPAVLSFTEFYISSQTITGLGHLEGETVQVNVDGAEHADVTVTAGAITLDRFPLTAQIGLANPARLVTMRLDGGSQTGTGQGKLKRVHQVAVRFADTVGGRVGPLGGTLDEIRFRTGSMPMDTAIPAFTGDKHVPFPGGSGRDDNFLTPNTRIEYRIDKPFPATVVGLMPNYVTSD